MKQWECFCTVNKSPLTLMLKILSKCGSVIVPNGANSLTPAFANRMSIRPFCSSTTAYNRLRSAILETSPWTLRILFSPICFTAASSSLWRRPVMKTYAPSETNLCAVASPIPPFPPVICL
jgi:hypothetical protein